MSGTVSGGKKAAATNKQKYGDDFYARLGTLGGRESRTGGFASRKRDADGLDGRGRARKWGTIGGTISRRYKREDS